MGQRIMRGARRRIEVVAGLDERRVVGGNAARAEGDDSAQFLAERNGELISIDSRPSDALAIALRRAPSTRRGYILIRSPVGLWR